MTDAVDAVLLRLEGDERVEEVRNAEALRRPSARSRRRTPRGTRRRAGTRARARGSTRRWSRRGRAPRRGRRPPARSRPAPGGPAARSRHPSARATPGCSLRRRSSSTTSGSPTMAWIAPGWCVWLRDMGTSDLRSVRRMRGPSDRSTGGSGNISGGFAGTESWYSPAMSDRRSCDSATLLRALDRPVDAKSPAGRSARATLAQISQAVGSRSRRCRPGCAGSRARGVIVGLPGAAGPRGGRQVALGVHRDHAARSLAARQRPRAARASDRDRGLPLDRRRRELHPLRPGRDAARSRGAHPRHPPRGIRQHAHDGGPADLLREPADRAIARETG